MMNEVPTDFGRRLASARLSGNALVGPAPELTLSEGYAVATATAAQMPPVIGWKVGATSAGAQAMLQIAEPIYGRIFQGSVSVDAELPPISGTRAAEIEPEIVFEMAADPEDVDPAAAIGRAMIGVEINRPSRNDALELGAAFIVADNAAQLGLIVGEAFALAELNEPANLRVTFMRNGQVEQTGDAAAVLGDPRTALEWLVRVRSGTERPVRKGDLVATGAMCRSVVLGLGDNATADFGPLGRIDCRRQT